MLSITDPGIPNGLTGNLAALMQTLIEKPMHERQISAQENRNSNDNAYKAATLAENIRNHNLTDNFHTGEVANGATRADTGAKRADTYATSVAQNGETSKARVDETVRHDKVTEGQAGDTEAGRNARADEANVRAMHNAWMNTPVGMMATPEEQEDHYNGLMEATQKRRASKAAISGKPAPTTQPAVDATAPAQPTAGGAPADTGYNTNAKATTPTLPESGVRLQGPAGPASTQQIQLLHRAAQWKVLPSLTDTDKQKVQQAIASKNFKALASMEEVLGGAAVGPHAR
jgi:hypothetical protein